ncbi:MAG TPA: GntR family transcriptional regulator [Clostridia bacterium]|jgi:DNA-binding GntR family transcriptional regulator|nr:MAG: putative HTH-type transcriptional regulator YurK [Firmicutes bacterium ADurb.Bin146]HOD93678.1 GntR family transcriptional regulator [Clostridia bacterium]
MINKYSSTPLYYQLKEELIKAIINGKYAPTEAIPSENELADLYKLSRPTVRQAIGELAKIGYLVKIKGKGTFVADFINKTTYDHTRGFIHCLLDTINTSNRKIIESTTINGTLELNRKFSTDFKSNYHEDYSKITYITETNGNISYSISILPLNYFPNAAELMFKNVNSIDLLVGKYPLDPTNAKSSIKLVNADSEIANQMKVQENAPLFKVETFLFARTGNIVEFNTTYYSAYNSILEFNRTRRI